MRANAPFTVAPRAVPTITKVISSYDTDPDTGDIRARVWSTSTDPVSGYPDIVTMTVTVQASGGASVWEPAVDKYTFIADRIEYAVDQHQDLLDSAGNPVEDALYLVFNTPPFSLRNLTVLNYGTINPLVNFRADQPVRDNQTGFQHSLFGFEQYLNPDARVRTRRVPHAVLMAFPNIISDFNITDAGFLRESKSAYFTSPPPYSPEIYEHDIVIRENTHVRYMVVNQTPVYIENIMVAQHFEMAELDPRSSIYSIPYVTG